MSLLTLQQDFRAWLTVEDADLAARCGTRSKAGLNVYLNNYRAQLMACLTETYGTVHGWLGDAAFEAAAATHIDRVSPKSWTLDAYGLDFPETLTGLYPEDPEVGELAELECTLAQLFVAGDTTPIGPAGLADIDWDRATFRFIPALIRLPATTNAGAIWSAVARGEKPPAAQRLPNGAVALVWREGFTPAFRTLDPAEAEALDLLQHGASFGTLCAQLVQREGEIDGPRIAGSYLAQWISDGIVANISSSSE
jgi:hypothetical protein